MRKIVQLLLPLALLTTPALAEEAADPRWTSEAELGLVTTGGNTDTQNINAKAKVVNTREQWRHTVKGEALGSKDSGQTTAERYLVSAKSDRKITDKNYLFVSADWEKDRFNGFVQRTSETVGYGRMLVDRPKLILDLELGVGARQSEEEVSGDRIDEGMARAAANLLWHINDHTRFTEEVNLDVGEESTVTRSVTALKSQLAGNFATKITYTFKNTSEVPAGTKNNDYETAVTLVYSF